MLKMPKLPDYSPFKVEAFFYALTFVTALGLSLNEAFNSQKEGVCSTGLIKDPQSNNLTIIEQFCDSVPGQNGKKMHVITRYNPNDSTAVIDTIYDDGTSSYLNNLNNLLDIKRAVPFIALPQEKQDLIETTEWAEKNTKRAYVN